ncbi:hypothetical protein [Rhizobium brockwellii]|nr:hypothetical protein [Rhizobium brockwellii]MDV4155249.1 hypothetical protein [Rhizobium brockwellii]
MAETSCIVFGEGRIYLVTIRLGVAAVLVVLVFDFQICLISRDRRIPVRL